MAATRMDGARAARLAIASAAASAADDESQSGGWSTSLESGFNIEYCARWPTDSATRVRGGGGGGATFAQLVAAGGPICRGRRRRSSSHRCPVRVCFNKHTHRANRLRRRKRSVRVTCEPPAKQTSHSAPAPAPARAGERTESRLAQSAAWCHDGCPLPVTGLVC